MEEKNLEKQVETLNVEDEKKEAPTQGKEERKPFNKKNQRRNNDRRPRHREEVKKEFEERVVHVNRVSKTVKGGRRMKFSVLVVVGNKKGKFGFAIGKSNEVPDAIKKALDKARRNTHTVKLVKNDTISHEVVGKFGASRVFLKPAPEGTGIIAGGPVRSILELCGVRNVYSKVYGSRTPINAIRATVEALNSLKSYDKVMSLRHGGNEDVK